MPKLENCDCSIPQESRRWRVFAYLALAPYWLGQLFRLVVSFGMFAFIAYFVYSFWPEISATWPVR